MTKKKKIIIMSSLVLLLAITAVSSLLSFIITLVAPTPSIELSIAVSFTSVSLCSVTVGFVGSLLPPLPRK